MTELRELMHQNVADPPHDSVDLQALVAAGRRRRRSRRIRVLGVAAAVTVSAVVGAAILVPRVSGAGPSAPPRPDAPTLHLSDASRGVAGRDYRVLTSYTNHNLDRDNGQYFDGVTDDGKILFRDGPRSGRLRPRLALMDPRTGTKDWLPDLHIGQTQTMPVELGAHRLILGAIGGGGFQGPFVAYVFDRDTGRWHQMRWPGLPDTTALHAEMGPDDRIWVSVPATQGQPPPGGWPTDSSGEADDAGAQGDTYHLWSVSASDPSDVRDEHLTVGSVAFTPTSMVWTDGTNGASGLVHVRDLSTGEERKFDPHAGSRCNMLSLSATQERVVLSEYCGTYADGVRDDRVQILSTTGGQVVTIQDSGMDGAINTLGGDNDVVTIDSYEHHGPGTYVYDLDSGRFLRISHGESRYALGGPAPADDFMWATPVNHGHGATLWLGRLRS
jgi:hypothetical protein